MKPFHERLQKYFVGVGKVLKGEADAASIFPNTTDIGMSREKIYAEVLKTHLPSSCNVSYGGFLFDQQGNESKQIDIIVSGPQSPQFNFHNKDGSGKSFACIDGCVGVVSVKSNLDSAQLVDSLENLASLPDKQPLRTDLVPPHVRIVGYDDWPYRIIYASDGVESPTIQKTLAEFYEKHQNIPFNKRPNLIHVIGKYAIVKTSERGAKTRAGERVAPQTFHSSPDDNFYHLIWTIASMQCVVSSSRYVIETYDQFLNTFPLE